MFSYHLRPQIRFLVFFLLTNSTQVYFLLCATVTQLCSYISDYISFWCRRAKRLYLYSWLRSAPLPASTRSHSKDMPEGRTSPADSFASIGFIGSCSVYFHATRTAEKPCSTYSSIARCQTTASTTMRAKTTNHSFPEKRSYLARAATLTVNRSRYWATIVPHNAVDIMYPPLLNVLPELSDEIKITVPG